MTNLYYLRRIFLPVLAKSFASYLKNDLIRNLNCFLMIFIFI
jgi:hypothetical protein